MTVVWIFATVLWAGLLTMRVETPWALASFRLALFALAIGLIVRRRGAVKLDPTAVLLAAAPVWALLQVAVGASVDPQRTLRSEERRVGKECRL